MVAVKNCGRENVRQDSLPPNTSVRDLCDCGRHKRFPVTPTGPIKRKPLETDTNYNMAYKPIKNTRPRSSKRPLRDLYDYKEPMTFDTNQRHDYKNLGFVDRVKPFIHSDNYEASADPIQSTTSYRSEFTQKKVLPEIRRVDTLRETNGQCKGDKFSSQTTSKEHYKQWKSQPAIAFRDLPTFTGSVLFPGTTDEPKSTFQSSYLGQYHPPAELCQTGKMFNLKNEGAMHMGTTNNAVYIPYEGDHRAKQVDQKPTIGMKQIRDKFNSQTQNMKDYGPDVLTNQRPAKAADPPPTTIKISFDDFPTYTTEQRSTYKGHDIRKHPVVKSFKQETKEYTHPTEKTDSMTSQKYDYKPIDLSQVERIKISRYANDKLKVGGKTIPFETSTTNKLFYKDWGTGERIRFGDYHDYHPYVAPIYPMEGESTTKGTYTVKKAERAEQHIPEPNLGRNEGSHSFDTEYRQQFKEQEIHVCPAQRFIIKKEMEKKLAAREVGTGNMGLLVVV